MSYQQLFNQTRNKEEAKQLFLKLAHQNHPDKGGNLEEMKAINNTYQNYLKQNRDTNKTQTDKETDQINENLIKQVNAIIGLDGVVIELLGTWIWVTGNTYTHKDKLKALGFHYASKKQAWYFHNKDEYSKTCSRGNYTMDKIKKTFANVDFASKVIKTFAPA